MPLGNIMNDTVTELLKGVLPFLGTALGGPLGAGAASFVASKLGVPADTVSETLNAMVADPTKLNDAKALEYTYKQHMQEIGLQSLKDLEELNVRMAETVNKTIQVEATAEHWPTYSWRPFNGFLFGITIFGCYFLLPLFKVPVPIVPIEVWAGWSAILGVSAWFRGKAQADPNVPATKQIPPGFRDGPG